MKHQITVDNSDALIILEGRIEQLEANELKDKLLSLVDSGCRTFTVDLNDTQYMDSAGLGMLVALRNAALDYGGFVRVINLHGKIKRLFELTCLSEIFTDEDVL